MINHARTLLLNKTREGNPDFPGEEYVPADFQPVLDLPQRVRKVRAILFGGDPDRYMLNYRLLQVMQMLHSTALDGNVYDFDSRITYLPFKQNTFYRDAFGTTVNALNTTGTIAAVATLEPDESAGRLYHNWKINVISSSLVNVRKLLPPIQEEDYPYTLTEGRSNLIPLLGSTLQFTFSGPVGSEWLVESLTRPQRTLADILTTMQEGFNEIDDNELFGVAPVEPYKTYRNLWRNHEQLAYQLGGLLMATIHRIDEARTKEP
jgi:hypothetical protein